MKKSIYAKNLSSGLFSQAIIILLKVIIPRITIISYGSDLNGLISTIGQIMAYLALLEAGIGQAARNALMKPISQNDEKGISYVASVADRYYKRFAAYYGIGVVLLALICPYIIRTEVDKLTVTAIFAFEGLSGVLSFAKIQTISCVISASGRNYAINRINASSKIAGYIAKICMAYFGVNILILEAVYFVLTIAKVFLFQRYFKKHYSWVKIEDVPKTEKLKDRNSYVLTEIAWTMFSATDAIVLSVFVSTKMASVYGIYNMVFGNINVLLGAVYASFSFTLGHTYHRDIKKYMILHDVFTSAFFGGMTCLMCATYILILPFIQLYTAGISDVAYTYSSLPVLFALVQMISWSRYITGNLSGIAGYAKITGRISLIEAVTNIALSVILVRKYGIVGVLVATVLALPVKAIFLTWLAEKKILKRNPIKYIVILLSNYALFGVTVAISTRIHLGITDYKGFFFCGVIVFFCCMTASVLLNCAANPEIIRLVKRYMGGRRRTSPQA